jgi:hypothetical protein
MTTIYNQNASLQAEGRISRREEEKPISLLDENSVVDLTYETDSQDHLRPEFFVEQKRQVVMQLLGIPIRGDSRERLWLGDDTINEICKLFGHEPESSVVNIIDASFCQKPCKTPKRPFRQNRLA